MIYRLHTLDIINGEINDEYRTSDTLDLPDNPTIEEIKTELVQLERMATDWPIHDVKLEYDGDAIFVTNKQGRKVYKLLPETPDN